MNADLVRLAIAIAQDVGPLTQADDATDNGLASAYANESIRLPGWCRCPVNQQEVYFSSQITGAHGWMCRTCRRTTQTG